MYQPGQLGNNKTLVVGSSTMPFVVEATDGLKQRCVVLTKMKGGEIETISLHVAQPGEEQGK